MVCPRCITSVKSIFDEMKIKTLRIELGTIEIQKPILEQEKAKLSQKLESIGFEILDDKNASQINQIKSIIIQAIHHDSEQIKTKFSELLSNKLNQEYSALSKKFSAVEGITIEKFIQKQKVEKIKELISYQQLNLNEIADQLNYSSSAHLSSQFKKITGLTPSQFKQLKKSDRDFLDKI